MRTGILNPQWRYRNSEATRKPGYLARRFADIRKSYAADWEAAHAENAERKSGNVRPMKKASAK